MQLAGYRQRPAPTFLPCFLSPFPPSSPKHGRRRICGMNGRGLDTRIPGSIFLVQVPVTNSPAGQPTVHRKYEEEEERNEREKERDRTMKKGETRIGNEGRDEGRNGDGGSVNKRWAGCGNAKTRCCACSVENKKLDGWGRARRGGTRSLSRELCRVFCRVIRTPPLPLRPRVLITRPF